MKIPKKSYAFIDGSFNPKTCVYGCGGFLVDQNGEKHYIKATGDDPNWSKMRNVAGEILGVMEAIRLAKALKMKKLKIFHDYIGLSKWISGEWRCNKEETLKYAEFIRNAISTGFELVFYHVSGHSGIDGNEMADRLAKKAVGLGVE